MPLDYQFDARNLSSPFGPVPRSPDMETSPDITPRVWGQTVFQFRDARTSDALRRAPEALRDAMEELRFGYGVHASPCPSGFYPRRDEVVREQLLMRLDEMIADGRLSFDDTDEDGVPLGPEAERFRLEGLVDSLMDAMPMPTDGLKRPRVTPLRHRVAFRVGVGIFTGLIAALLVGFVGPGVAPFNDVLSQLR